MTLQTTGWTKFKYSLEGTVHYRYFAPHIQTLDCYLRIDTNSQTIHQYSVYYAKGPYKTNKACIGFTVDCNPRLYYNSSNVTIILAEALKHALIQRL